MLGMFRFGCGALFDVRWVWTRPIPRLALIRLLKTYIGRVRRRETTERGKDREKGAAGDNARKDEWAIGKRDNWANRR